MEIYLTVTKVVTPTMSEPFRASYLLEAYTDRDTRDYWAADVAEDEEKVKVDLEIPGKIEDLFSGKKMEGVILPPLCTEG